MGKIFVLNWFVKTSKQYMGYGGSISKIKFWINFPFAYTRFLYYQIKSL